MDKLIEDINFNTAILGTTSNKYNKILIDHWLKNSNDSFYKKKYKDKTALKKDISIINSFQLNYIDKTDYNIHLYNKWMNESIDSPYKTIDDVQSLLRTKDLRRKPIKVRGHTFLKKSNSTKHNYNLRSKC